MIEAIGAPRRRPRAPRPSRLPPAARPAPPRRPLADIAALHWPDPVPPRPQPLAEDQLIRDLTLPAALVSPELLTLELDGRILRQPGGLLSRIG